MTKVNKIQAATFIGRPFPDSLIDEQKSFAQSNLALENDAEWQQFLTANQLDNTRASMVVFGPQNFMYWYGIITGEQNITVPKGLMKFTLPQAEVFQHEQLDQSQSYFSLPLNRVLSEFLATAAKQGVQVYENMGDSDLPYVWQSLDLTTKKLTQTMYLRVSQ